MTAIGPRPPDIAFDHAAARAAVDALRRAATVLSEVDGTRAAAGVRAAWDFTGAHSRSFAAAHEALGLDASDARAEMQALADRIEDAAAAATTAQQQRALDQATWDRAAAVQADTPRTTAA